MKKSHNILIIKNLTYATGTSPDNRIFKAQAELTAKITFNCPDTGKCFSSIDIISEGFGYDQDGTLRDCIQNFFNGRFARTPHIYDVQVACEMDRDNIHHLDTSVLDNRLRSLFHSLFDPLKWVIPDPELPA